MDGGFSILDTIDTRPQLSSTSYIVKTDLGPVQITRRRNQNSLESATTAFAILSSGYKALGEIPAQSITKKRFEIEGGSVELLLTMDSELLESYGFDALVSPTLILRKLSNDSQTVWAKEIVRQKGLFTANLNWDVHRAEGNDFLLVGPYGYSRELALVDAPTYGGFDIAVLRVTEDGELVGSSFFGGEGHEFYGGSHFSHRYQQIYVGGTKYPDVWSSDRMGGPVSMGFVVAVPMPSRTQVGLRNKNASKRKPPPLGSFKINGQNSLGIRSDQSFPRFFIPQ